ncbi:MAG: NACHT domain-containing protein [Cyanobacteria bacterium J06629_18]
MKKILVLASNPKGDLKNLDSEIRDLQDALEKNIQQQIDKKYEVVFKTAVRPSDLLASLRYHKPQIVHFCGHGTGEKGLLFQDDNGREQLVSTEALVRSFEYFAKDIECSVFNACTSYIQAEAVAKHINYAIGMSEEILDRAAYIFAVGFYEALADEESIERAYESGCIAVQIQLETLRRKTSRSSRSSTNREFVAIDSEILVKPEHAKPKLYKKSISSSNNNLEQNNLEHTLELEGDLENKLSSSIKAKVSSNFVESIVQEVERKEYKDGTREAWEQFGQISARERVQPITKQEYQQRKVLLSKVKDFWIEGFLKPSLYADEAINLDLKKRSDAVSKPFEGVEEFIELNESFEELQQTDIHDQIGFGKTLLILGEPGSGKTIALLQMAQRLVEQMENDLSQPIPVVFNLSSWTKKRQPIEKWLIEELKEKYQVPKTLSEPWIQQEKLILLLDGLDEVQEKYRNECVRALNTFIINHNITEMVVCSRVKDYEALTERLQLSSAICIKPMSPEKVYEFLDEAGNSLAGLKKLLQRDTELETFARTPLILNIMSVTYQGWSEEELFQEFRSSENRYQNLFDAYIQRMLARRGASEKYPKEKVKRWLTWLAKRMVNESQTVFLIEKMQPTWLNNQTEIKAYRIRNSLFGALSFVLIIVLISLLSAPFYQSQSSPEDELMGWLFMLFTAMIPGLILWFPIEIKLLEQMSWSWQRAGSRLIRELRVGGLAGGIFGVIFGVLIAVSEYAGSLLYMVLASIVFGIIFAVIGGLITGLSSGLGGTEVEHRTVPNQGIKSSAKNFAIVVLGLTLILALLLRSISGHNVDTETLAGLLIIALMFGFIGGLRYGGTACIQHLNLRLMLTQKGRIPWNYASFLDYSAKRLLMKKVGGGYMFYHRMLLEHFAGIKQADVTQNPVPVVNNLTCKNCGQENSVANNFCIKCGMRL